MNEESIKEEDRLEFLFKLTIACEFFVLILIFLSDCTNLPLGILNEKIDPIISQRLLATLL